MHAFKLAASAFALAFSFTALAANLPPGFDQAKWDGLLTKTIEKGQVLQIQAGELRYLSRVDNDTTINHQAAYFSVLGKYDSNSKYQAVEASSVDETWQLDQQGDWTIDQWTYHIALSGELTDITHSRIVEHDGVVKDYKELEAGLPTDAANVERWGQLLSTWITQAARLERRY